MSRLIPTLAVAGLFLANNLGYGQATNPPANPDPNNNQVTAGTTVQGKVVRVDGQDRIIIQTPENKEVILFSNPNTQYVIDGKTGRFADIRTGVNVNATYTTQDNRYMVSSLRVGDAPNATTPGATPPASATAGTASGAAGGTAVQGKVVRVEGQDRIVVLTNDNKEVVLMANPTTRYLIYGKAGRFADLRTGTIVSANYIAEGNRYVVNSIQVGDAPAVATQPGGINERKFRGRVVRVDAANNQIVAKSQDGKEVTLFVQKNGRFLRNGQAVRMADIQVGTIIEAQYLERDNHWWVDEVLIVTDTAEPTADGTQLQGTVVRIVGNNQVIIRTKDNKEVTIDLVPQTVYTFDNQPGQFVDVQPGQDVRVQYNTQNRRSIASRIFGNRRK